MPMAGGSHYDVLMQQSTTWSHVWGYGWQRVRETARAWWRIWHLGAISAVLLLSPSTYGAAGRKLLVRKLYADTIPVLPGFTVLAALLCLVITHIVVVTAASYGLTRYALEMVIRVLVLELIPLTAALFVAMRCSIPNGTSLAMLRDAGYLDQLTAQGRDPLREEVFPRVLSGMYASITLAALSCAVATVTAYLAVYEFNAAGFPVFTRMFGQVFTPPVTVLFALKTFFFSLAIALIPTASGLYEQRPQKAIQPGQELNGLVRMFVVLLLIEIASLMGNYY